MSLLAQCDIGKSFAQKKTLDQHISDVHEKLKPYKCDDCGESFAQKSSLDKHIASQHREDLKLVKCPDCDLKFKHSKELEKHITQFHTVTNYKCRHCNKQVFSYREWFESAHQEMVKNQKL